jgi:hypothetical protein
MKQQKQNLEAVSTAEPSDEIMKQIMRGVMRVTVGVAAVTP